MDAGAQALLGQGGRGEPAPHPLTPSGGFFIQFELPRERTQNTKIKKITNKEGKKERNRVFKKNKLMRKRAEAGARPPRGLTPTGSGAGQGVPTPPQGPAGTAWSFPGGTSLGQGRANLSRTLSPLSWGARWLPPPPPSPAGGNEVRATGDKVTGTGDEVRTAAPIPPRPTAGMG